MLPMCFMLATDILRPYLIKGKFTTYSLHINSIKLNSDKLCPARILELDGVLQNVMKSRRPSRIAYTQKNNILY